tara:strand:+ start:2824 stop:2985 length:162 start_codon:yes stop_codon:yes gene_type:complete
MSQTTFTITFAELQLLVAAAVAEAMARQDEEDSSDEEDSTGGCDLGSGSLRIK